MNTIRAWLGHVSLDTTHIYAEADLQMKARALPSVGIGDLPTTPARRKPVAAVMDFAGHPEWQCEVEHTICPL